jgi:transcriptional regulator
MMCISVAAVRIVLKGCWNRLTGDNMKKEWQQLRESGLSCKIIGDRFGVSRSNVSRCTKPPKNKIEPKPRIKIIEHHNAKLPDSIMVAGGLG